MPMPALEEISETPRLCLRELKQSDFDSLCLILRDEETMYAYEGAPGWTSASFLAVSTHRENSRSVESTLPDRNGTTPQEMASCRRTRSSVVRAATAHPGRKREIIRAV